MISDKKELAVNVTSEEQFSLLLLEPGEIYFEDFSAFMFPADTNIHDFERKRVIGRLKMCSKSIVFDPKDINKPIVKISLKECIDICEWNNPLLSKISSNRNVICVDCKQYVDILEGNILAPYKFKGVKQKFLFLLNYAMVDDCLPQILQLHRASSLAAAEQSSMIAAIVYSRQSRVSFDTLWLEDLYEKVVLETQGSKITPLVVNPGRILLTSSRLYFQPYNNIEPPPSLSCSFSHSCSIHIVPAHLASSLSMSSSDSPPGHDNVHYPVLKIRLQDIRMIIKRRFLLRHVGLLATQLMKLRTCCLKKAGKAREVLMTLTNVYEIATLPLAPCQQTLGLEVYCEGNSHLKHLYLSFKSPEERDILYQGLIGQHSLRLDNTDQEMMTLQWQNGVISNYDYLMYLNSLADRTFNDLTQYPVFPWVISDMSSSTLDLSDSSCFRDLRKPVGALNPIRLKRLKERCEEMPPPKFLYGSHYSAPGFVLFYLVRKFPHYMLCLQNGRFDHPDRMFNSVPDVWKNVMNNMSDFKELVPAFYDTSQKGDFLVNSFGINFGNRHDGAKVGDVHLPLWAQGPEDFVRKLREALESDYVSKHLHHWIDLIFGCKQIGPEAEKADNLFYYLCYEGSVDLDSIKDLNQRHALEVQIMEFGQIPKHIFTLPHPHRLMGLPPTLATSHSCDFSESRDVQECVQSLTGHIVWHRTETLMTVALFQSHKESVCATALSGSGQFVVSVGQDSLLKMYSLAEKRQVRSVTLSSMALSSCIVLPDEKTLIVGCWNNSIILYNLEFGRIVDSIRAHEDAVSCLCWTNSTQMLVSGSWDCSIRIWQGMAEGKRIKPATALVAQLDHDAHITCLDITRDGELLVSGTQEGDLFLWYMESHLLKQKMQGHSGSVYAASFSPDGKKLVSCGEDGSFKVVDLSTGMLLYSKTLEEELRDRTQDP
uniref:Protein FAN n=1 Tax=Timema cristinae TaxID=61476 RepID=A0A7R9H1T4_TIMCR|nr:unnamed protein product [Timema cristinae]